jgi:hypothetical protein
LPPFDGVLILFEYCCNLFPIACKTFYRLAKQKTSPILLFPC